MKPVPVIALDGPGGVGKGTLGRLLAAELGWRLLDSGAIYRALALAALEQAVSLDDGPRLAQLAETLPLDFRGAGGETEILLGGRRVNEAIRAEEVGGAASRVAAIPDVRAALLARQRAFRRPPGLVADGRDMGTVVFPDACLKVFLTASTEERAQRRFKQLKGQGINASLSAVHEEIVQRDVRDRQRAVAPLVPAADARILDTSGQSVPESLAILLNWARIALAEQG